MQLDTFLISILFDDAKAIESANKIDGIVKNLAANITKYFAAIASIDFLKNAVEQTVELATRLDNLSYATGVSKENLNAWGEAVKRNGGTTEQFYASVSNLAAKIREIQTNFGSPGQLAFARLGISLRDSTGHVKNAIQVLGDLGNKFKDLPKTWQLKLGEMLGLDQATIRLLGTGNKEVQDLVKHMQMLGNINERNVKASLQFRNAMFDLQLVWQSTKNTLTELLVPALKVFTYYLERTLLFLRNNPYLIQAALISVAAVVTTILAPAFVRLSLSMAPFLGIGAIIAGIALVIQDLIVWLHGGKSAFGEYYQAIANATVGIREFISQHKEGLITLTKIIGALSIAFGVLRIAMIAVSATPLGAAISLVAIALVGLITHWQDVINLMDRFGAGAEKLYNRVKGFVGGYYNNVKDSATQEYNASKDTIINTISSAAKALGFDPTKAATIANIESGLNPNAKSLMSSASGLFQLTNATANESGVANMDMKNDPTINARAGILNLKRTNSALAKYLGRMPTGAELYLGEMLGISGSEKVLSANANTPLSSLLSNAAIKANPQFANKTAGQLINNANRTYQQKSITMGDIHINAPGANSQEVAAHIHGHLANQFNQLITNSDNGVKV